MNHSMQLTDDDLLFADDDAASAFGDERWWRLLVVDDEADVHAVTKVVLADFQYGGRRLDIQSAYSALEARELLRRHDDIALILLDVVMEETDSGLSLVRFVREDLKNRQVRIVLRTGQPGYAPERDVIVRYDINDYKEKTELTAQKLFTTVLASLRGYEYLMYLEQQRSGLEQIVHAHRELCCRLDRSEFCLSTLAFLSALANASAGVIVRREGADYEVLATLNAGPGIDEVSAILSRSNDQAVFQADGSALVVLPSRAGNPAYACLTGIRSNTERDDTLLTIFAEAVGALLDNVLLLGRLQDAQKAMVIALARMGEFRDADTGRHVRRVEQLVRSLALQLRERDDFSCLRDDLYLEQLTLASILHDVGKIGVPDAVLNKPGKLSQDERSLMNDHVTIGAQILAEAAKMVPGTSYLSLAAEIAANHHESVDGSGYPMQKTLQDIPLSARIVAVADVFDALVSPRPYKEGWPVAKAIALLREQAGRRFDPAVVEALEAVLIASKILPDGDQGSST